MGAGVPTPVDLPSGVEVEPEIRLLVKSAALTYFAEAAYSSQVDERTYKAVTLGAYYRLSENFRGGLFYRRQYGVRHDADWIKGPVGWYWNNANNRGEDVLILDASPRVKLEFLPGRSWTGELKNRYFYNTFNSQSTFVTRPGLTYFWLRNEKPFVNVFLQYEIYFPLNYGVKTIYETWAYLGALYNIMPTFQLAGYVARKSETWGNTPEFFKLSGETYSVQATTTVLGLVAVFNLGR